MGRLCRDPAGGAGKDLSAPDRCSWRVAWSDGRQPEVGKSPSVELRFDLARVNVNGIVIGPPREQVCAPDESSRAGQRPADPLRWAIFQEAEMVAGIANKPVRLPDDSAEGVMAMCGKVSRARASLHHAGRSPERAADWLRARS